MAIATNEQTVVDQVEKHLYIGGEWIDASEGRTLPVEDPATGEALCEVADANPADALRALDAAVDAQADWAKVPPIDRGEILRRSFEKLTERADELALLMTLEMGKPLAESKAEIAYAAEFFRWFAGEATRIHGQFNMAGNGVGRVLTLKQPIGPCVQITPWNFPMAMGTRKIGPAIAAGCTMVMKPASQTPLSMLALGQILEEAGLPGGVLNIVTSSSSGKTMEPLIRDPRTRKLSFTGSTEVGRMLLEQASEQILKVSMELGGNAPFLIFEDADLDAAVEGAVVAKMRNGGQACTAANRFLVHAAVANEFTTRLGAALAALRIGDGLAPTTEVGPLINGAARAEMARLVAGSLDAGAVVQTGGRAPERPGYFYEPTVLAGVPQDAGILDEEIFGPIAPVVAFETEDEALALANRSALGLAAYVFTRDLGRGLRIAEAIEAGMVAINRGLLSDPAAPFGGVKQSGIGREGGHEGILEFTECKYVSTNW